MSDSTALFIALGLGLGLGLGLAVALVLGYRWRKRRIAGRGLAVVPMPTEDWTDEDIDRLLAALQSPDDDEHQEAFV